MKMKIGRCYECGHEGNIAGMIWGGKDYGYVNYCENCQKKFSDDQYVGMEIRNNRPDDYKRLLRTKYGPRKIIAYHSGGDWLTFSVPDDGLDDIREDSKHD